MSESLEIGLHKAGAAPGTGELARWVVGGNLFVLSILSLMFVVVPWSTGSTLAVDFASLAGAGAVGAVLMGGFLVVAFKRQAGQRKPAAMLRLEPDAVSIVGEGTEAASCAREDWAAQPVHAYEMLRGSEYYMGPALAISFGDDEEIIVATIDAKHRWQHDPRGVPRIDWLCTAKDWAELLRVEDLSDALVAYAGDQNAHM